MRANELSARFECRVVLRPTLPRRTHEWTCQLRDHEGNVVGTGHADTRAGSLQMAALNWKEGF